MQSYNTESKKEDLVFNFWVPDSFHFMSQNDLCQIQKCHQEEADRDQT